ncbi:hypothetical protein [Candidatus Similichlamydia epinepheli]|uniref:hypothetical protein n=1 Tax=Candidatus Similichlamydia epinepheli TaxID=1903953 RepID=UPI0013006F27|nr:hypothetical protein [Candidatus Similichlamydia epinepheli]
MGAMVRIGSFTYGPPSVEQKTTTSLLNRSILHVALAEVNKEERKRLEKELEIVKQNIQRLHNLTNDTSFLTKAPPSVKKKQKESLEKLQDQLKKIEKKIN